jgi:large subunit ribosomal protein L32e
MADEPKDRDAPAPPETSAPSPKRRASRPAVPSAPAPAEPEASPPKGAGDEAPRAPKRATLEPALAHLLLVRSAIDRRRPVFGRQAANRYLRIGRDGAWRRARGLQSKQRRHYGFRSEIVRIGYRSPARVRGLVPSGFVPVLVRSVGELEGIDGHRQAAIIARTVGTRLRLVLEEEARKLGIRVLNPIVTSEDEA